MTDAFYICTKYFDLRSSAQAKVCTMVGGVESEFNDHLWLELSLGRAEQ